jgi:hypothetical protein
MKKKCKVFKMNVCDIILDREDQAEELVRILNDRFGIGVGCRSVEVFEKEDINDTGKAMCALNYHSSNHGNLVIHADYINSVSAYHKLKLYCDAWNKIDNFTPDFEDFKQSKYMPCFKIENGSYEISSCTGSLLIPGFFYFKSRDTAVRFAMKYIDLFMALDRNMKIGNI